MDCYVFRYFNVYGAREPLIGEYAPVVGLFKRQKLANSPLTIVGDGTQRRDFTYVSDVVEANIKAATQELSYGFRIWNVGCGKNYSINDIANMIGGERCYIPRRPAEVHVTLADISDTVSELGWTPKYN